MADLTAIGYDDEVTAHRAAEAVRAMDGGRAIRPDAVAVIVSDREGVYRATTNHHTVGAGATWGMFWDPLFGLLLYTPVLGMRVGPGLGALFGKVEKAGIDRAFQQRVRDMLEPGTSALFFVADDATAAEAVGRLGHLGGTALRSSLSDDAQDELQSALHGRREFASSV